MRLTSTLLPHRTQILKTKVLARLMDHLATAPDGSRLQACLLSLLQVMLWCGTESQRAAIRTTHGLLDAVLHVISQLRKVRTGACLGLRPYTRRSQYVRCAIRQSLDAEVQRQSNTVRDSHSADQASQFLRRPTLQVLQRCLEYAVSCCRWLWPSGAVSRARLAQLVGLLDPSVMFLFKYVPGCRVRRAWHILGSRGCPPPPHTPPPQHQARAVHHLRVLSV